MAVLFFSGLFASLYGQNGQQLFNNNCAVCHGTEGHGNTPMGKAISNLPDLASPSTDQLSDEEIFDIITNGKGVMPAFQQKLSDADRKALIKYVRSLSEKK